MVITDANKFVADIHDRMPVILEPERHFEQWERGNVKEATALMKPASEDLLEKRPVSRRVNSSRVRTPSDGMLIEAVEKEEVRYYKILGASGCAGPGSSAGRPEPPGRLGPSGNDPSRKNAAGGCLRAVHKRVGACAFLSPYSRFEPAMCAESCRGSRFRGCVFCASRCMASA